MDVKSAEMKLEENKRLKKDLNNLKDELASTKKSEDCLSVTPRGFTVCCCTLFQVFIAHFMQNQDLGGNKHKAI